MTSKFRTSLGWLASLFLMAHVQADDLTPITDEVPALGRPVEFQTDVKPILTANCVACHNVTTSEGELILESVEAMLKGGTNGPAVVPGKPEESLIWKLARRGEEPVMPPLPNDRQANQLTPVQLGLLKQWITEGANAGSASAARVMNWQPINPRLHGVYSLDLDPTGRFIAAGRANQVTIYDLARRDVPQVLRDPLLAVDGAGPDSATAHRDFVHAIAFHPSEPIVATSGFRNVKLWQRNVSELTAAAALPPESQLWVPTGTDNDIAVAVSGQGLSVMDASTGVIRGTASLDGQTVTALTAFRSDPRWLIAATSDQRLVVIRSADMQIVHRSEPMSSPVAALSAELDGARTVALLSDGSARLLSVTADSGAIAIVAEIKSDAGAITKVAGAGAFVLTVAGTRTVQVWNAADASAVNRFDASGDIAAVTFQATSDRAVFIVDGSRAVLWSPKEAREIAALIADLPAQRRLKQADTRKAMFDSRVGVIKAQIDEADKDIAAQKEAETKAKAEVEKQVPLQAEAQKKFDEAAARTAEAKKVLEAKTDDEALKTAVAEADKAEAAAKEVVTKADGELATARKSVDFAAQAIVRAEQRAADHRVRHEAAVADALMAATTAEGLKAPAAVPVSSTFAGLTADGRVAWTADASGTLRLWNATDGTALDVLSRTAIGSPVVAATANDSVVWMRTEDQRIVRQSLYPEWSLLRSIGSEEGAETPFVDRVLALAFSPDGALLAAGGGEASRSGELTIWNTHDGTLARRFVDAHSDTVFGVEFSADGRLLASAAADKFVKVFDVASGEFVRAFEGHTHHVMDVAWKSDRTTLASAGADNAIKIWNVETGEQARTITTYSRQVTSLQFVGQQDLIVSGSGDRRVFLHTSGNGQPAREFPGNGDYVYRVATNSDGTLIVSGGEDGSVRVWNAADAAVVQVFEP